jgi:small subunit ribosomal protein S6
VKTYEALIVFKPVLDVDNTEALIKNVENTIANLKGKVVKMDKVGRKRLAYEMGKFKDGFITTIWMELPAEAVVEFKKLCQLNEDILRLTMIRLDNPELAVVGTTTTAVGHGGNPREREFHPRGERGGDRDHRGGDRDHRGPREHRGEFRGDREPQGERPPINR